MTTSIYFDRAPSPLGTLVLATNGNALTGIWFDGQRYQPPIGFDWKRQQDSALLQRARSLLTAYFAGHRPGFDVPVEPHGTPFQRAVWQAIATVPYGETIAYRELARRVGRPHSVRAVGAATGRNPLSIMIPCHRIVGADGSLTGYAGGLDRKRALLALESGTSASAAVRRAA